MRIAVTGGTGFIGQCLLREYAGVHSFVVFTPDPARDGLFHRDAVEYFLISREAAKGINPFEAYLDLLGQCGGVVNLGFARPVVGKPDSFSDYLSSVSQSGLLMDACARAGLRNVVHVSSRSVYGKHMPIPHTEEEAIYPFSNYGAAKAAAEAIASAYNARGFLDAKVLRFAQVFGRGEYQGVVSAYVKALETGKPLQVWGVGNESKREYLYVKDACSSIVGALEHSDASGVYNIGSGVSTDLLELIAALRVAAGNRAIDVETRPEKPVERVDYLMSSEKARADLGWAAQWTLEDALADMLAS